jgi:hypothetical protein
MNLETLKMLRGSSIEEVGAWRRENEHQHPKETWRLIRMLWKFDGTILEPDDVGRLLLSEVTDLRADFEKLVEQLRKK